MIEKRHETGCRIVGMRRSGNQKGDCVKFDPQLIKQPIVIMICMVWITGLGFAQDLPTPYFTDVTQELGLGSASGFYISIADLNGDDYPDLFLTDFMDEATGDVYKKQRLYMNRPGDDPSDPFSRKFVDVTEESGIWANRRNTDEGRHSDLAVFGDVDNDGDLDYFSGLYFHRLESYTDTGDRNDLMLNDGKGHFLFTSDLTFFDAGLVNSAGAVFTDYDLDGKLDLWLGNWFLDYANNIKSMDLLYKGDGTGAFTDVTAAAHLDVTQPSYGVSVADTDGDGWPDLFSANYCRGPSKHFHNNRDGTFTEIGATSHYGQYVGPDTGCCSWGSMPRDYDNDGDIDFLEVLVHGNLQVHSCPLVNANDVFTWDFASVNRTDDPRPRHNGDHYGSWIDYDNDGLVDFVLTENGYDNNRIYLFRHEPDHTFNVVTLEAGLSGINDQNLSTHNASVFDYDLDGDEDIIFGFPDARMVGVYRNDVGSLNNWLTVSLQGAGVPGKSNRDAIGAKVAVTAGGVTYTRFVDAGSGHFSPQMPFNLSFGLGSADKIDTIMVTWPNLTQSTLIMKDISVNQMIKIYEPHYSDEPQLGMRMEMPETHFVPGKKCYLTAYLHNEHAPRENVPMFVLLEVMGEYWFWDKWTQDVGYKRIHLPSGTSCINVLPEFTWPDTGTSSFSSINFIGCLLNNDMDEVMGDVNGIGYWSFGFGPS